MSSSSAKGTGISGGRKLVVVVHADIVGYSRLIGVDDSGTLERVRALRREDRGPYVDGGTVDVAPGVANELDMKKGGVTPVEIAPIAVPQANGRPKLEAGAADANPPKSVRETEAATR